MMSSVMARTLSSNIGRSWFVNQSLSSILRGHVVEELDPEPDFGEGHDADIEKVQGLTGDELQNIAVGSRPPELRQDIRVEQPTRHRSTPRTGA